MSAPRKTIALVAALLAITVVPTTSDALSSPWLEADFEGGVSGVFDSISGLSSGSGHQGEGARVRIPTGEHWGATGHWNTQSHLGSEPEEMWIRYWVKFPVGFRVDAPYRGKLPGFGGLYTYNCLGGRPSTAAAPCWSARLAFSPMYPADGLPSYSYNPSAVTRVSFYSYLLDSNEVGQTGKILNWDPDLSTLQHGQWYCLEARVKMNSLGSQNGVLEGYVDGEQAFNATNLSFRRAGEPNLKVKSLWFDIYYGGSGTSPKSNEIHFDSLAAGPGRVGCNDKQNSSGTFYDDDESVFENAIEKLAASGITQGCNPPTNDRFCPDDAVTRGQMAAFLKRALGDRYPVNLSDPPDSPPGFWGGKSSQNYKTALAVYDSGGAAFDTYVVRYWVDDTTGDRDWMKGGTTGNPNYWVPIQLGRIWDAGATPYVRITAHDLPGLASGKHDTRLSRLLATLARFTDQGEGRRVILDILPEANNQYNDYGDDPSRFKTAFRRVSEQARSTLGKDNVRIAFSAHRVMNSNRYSSSQWGGGGHRLYWPGDTYVDVAGVSGFPSTGGSDVSYYEAALDEMSDTAGPGEPLMISAGGAPNNPDEAAQIEFVQAMADLVNAHPQVVGAQWEDRVSGQLDLRVSSATSLQTGFAAASSTARAGGVDWLFSPAAETWSEARIGAFPFDDTTSSVFVNSIRWLKATGITQGCGPRLFCPDDRVTRGQMAAFLSRALKLPSPQTPVEFTDSKGHLFENAISRLAHAGITLGCNPPSNNRFCPNRYVTRGQMAAFMVRAGLTD